jgi:alpha-glucuronidase
MDRTVATGTGYIGQYPAPLATKYESLKTCPDELLLFMHHVPYTYKLHSGQTVMQYIDDTHYWGAAAAQAQVPAWESLQGKIPDGLYAEELRRLKFQAAHAVVWRDAVTEYFTKMSGIADDKGRVGHYPGRIEAEAMKLEGYTPADVTPWETASGGKAVVCAAKECSAETTWDKADGWYDIHVQYFDLPRGVSHFTLSVAGNPVDQWAANDTLPTPRMNGSSTVRETIRHVAIHKGDVVRVTGRPDGTEQAPLDYLEILPSQTR